MESVGVLHYSAPPVVGGVEAVIKAHVQEFLRAGYPCTVITGRGQLDALPPGAGLIEIPEIDSQHPDVINISRKLEKGQVPAEYQSMEKRLVKVLGPVLGKIDHLIVHNVFSKHFNLPLTAALHQLLEQGAIHHAIAWCHDFTWTSPNSRSKVYPGYPWDLLRTHRPDCIYVTVSQERQHTLAALFQCPVDDIAVVYNGVNPVQLLGLSEEGYSLISRLGMMDRELNILMPVRVTQAKNIEFAIEVAAALKKMGKKPLLLITGPPDPHDPQNKEYYQSLKDRRELLGVKDEVRFVFESGLDPQEPFLIDEQVVGDLYRVSDMMFMPSHREGFGMPVLEAGLVGIPVVSRDVPAAHEIAGTEAVIIPADMDASQTAAYLVEILEQSPTAKLRRYVRMHYTWRAIFEDSIKPLLSVG